MRIRSKSRTVKNSTENKCGRGKENVQNATLIMTRDGEWGGIFIFPDDYGGGSEGLSLISKTASCTGLRTLLATLLCRNMSHPKDIIFALFGRA